MTNLINKLELIDNITLDGMDLALLDTTPSPDTILLHFSKLGIINEALYLEAIGLFAIAYNLAIYWQNNVLSPIERTLLETTPTPDTILLYWHSEAQPVMPLYPGDTKSDPSITPYAGGVYGYL